MRYRDIVNCILSQGWSAQSQSGSHHVYSKSGCSSITLAFGNINAQVTPGDANNILRDLRAKGVNTSSLE